MSVTAFILLSSSLLCSAQVTEKFLDAVAMVESSGRANQIGDGGKAMGMFQLHSAAWEDARKINPSLADYKTGAMNRETARRAARIYLTTLAARLERATGRTPSPDEVYAAFNLGFTGFKQRGFNLHRAPKTTKAAIKRLGGFLK